MATLVEKHIKYENLICNLTRFYILDLPNAKISGKKVCFSLHAYSRYSIFANSWKFIQVN